MFFKIEFILVFEYNSAIINITSIANRVTFLKLVIIICVDSRLNDIGIQTKLGKEKLKFE